MIVGVIHEYNEKQKHIRIYSDHWPVARLIVSLLYNYMDIFNMVDVKDHFICTCNKLLQCLGSDK